MKTCQKQGCNSPVFSMGFCRIHQWCRTDEGHKKYKGLKKQNKIARRTPKRTKDERQYKDQAREFFDDAVKNGTNLCVFCGQKVTKFEGLHHLRGRINDHLLDKEFWCTVHNFCHVELYHQSSYGKLSKQPWYNDFLSRLKAKDESLWRLEIKKGEKSQQRLNFNDNYLDF